MPNLPNINIFMLAQKPEKVEKRESPLARALRGKKDDQKHQELMGQLSTMIRELRVLPHVAHSGGG